MTRRPDPDPSLTRQQRMAGFAIAGTAVVWMLLQFAGAQGLITARVLFEVTEAAGKAGEKAQATDFQATPEAAVNAIFARATPVTRRCTVSFWIRNTCRMRQMVPTE